MENKTFSVLKSSKDFENIKLKGKRKFLDKKILVCYFENGLTHHRVGWTLPKSVGNSVLRNKLKRYARVFFRTDHQLIYKSNYDVNLVFLKSGSHQFKRMDYNEFRELLLPCWQRITE